MLLLAFVTAACSELTAGSPMADARNSPEALARAALDAIAAGAEDDLDVLRISRTEYEDLLWPILPDREHVPFEFVWSITEPRSRKARGRIIADYHGIPLELARVDTGDEIERYDAFTLYKDARMIVRRTDTGQEGTFPLMDVLVHMGGGWKFMNFKD